MRETALDLLRSLRRKDVRVGLAVGFAGFVFSWAFSFVVPGRLLGNPMPLVLAVSALGRAVGQGFSYFNWQDPALHLGFVAALSIMSAAAAARFDLEGGSRGRIASRLGRIAVGLNVLASAWEEIDAITVALFYMGGGYLTVIATGMIAGWAAGWLAPVAKANQTR